MSRVLIIEDEKETATPVKEALAIENIDADIANNGLEGLQKFEKESYDLILLDLKMPGISGEEVLNEIRKIDPYIDVIVYTNYSDYADIKKLTNIGIQGYINKGPQSNLTELVKFIEKKLEPLDEESVEKLVRLTPSDMFINEGKRN